MRSGDPRDLGGGSHRRPLPGTLVRQTASTALADESIQIRVDAMHAAAATRRLMTLAHHRARHPPRRHDQQKVVEHV
jgi:hypothetical protein